MSTPEVLSSPDQLRPPQRTAPRDVNYLCALITQRTANADVPRTVIGLVGEPGAGKSTLAQELVEALGADAAVVPMDGFHLSNQVLDTLGRRQRKGAPDTFDAHGFTHLVQRLRHQREDIVYAPMFRRDLDEPIAGSIPISRKTSVVIIEGNYLLLAEEPWRDIRQHLDDTWYLELNRDVRLRRLAERHQSFGLTPEHAWHWAQTQDQVNAELVRDTRVDARLVIRGD
ncbi:MAG TPA: nucleoside/nucleotide kinase family protein [Pedococcus sp.]|nr:nucleoside/nucleotide kinase family protein [Pedococcus sp.]